MFLHNLVNLDTDFFSSISFELRFTQYGIFQKSIVNPCKIPLDASLSQIMTSHWPTCRTLFCCRSSWRACQSGWSLDLLNQCANTRALSLFDHRIWQSRNSEVHDHIVHNSFLVISVLSWFVSSPTWTFVLSWEERVFLASCAWLASRQLTRVPALS